MRATPLLFVRLRRPLKRTTAPLTGFPALRTRNLSRTRRPARTRRGLTRRRSFGSAGRVARGSLHQQLDVAVLGLAGAAVLLPCGSLYASTRLIAASCVDVEVARRPGRGRADGRGAVDQRAEDRQRPVAVVHHLEQAALRRPVADRRALDLPPSAAALGLGRTRRCGSRACGRPRRRPRAGSASSAPVRSVAEVHRRRRARVEVAAGLRVVPGVVASVHGAPPRRRPRVQARIGVVAEQHHQLVARGRLVELASATDTAGRRCCPSAENGDHAALGDRVERDEAEAAARAPRVVARRRRSRPCPRPGRRSEAVGVGLLAVRRVAP